ncbi:MAG: M15 family peptidase [Deltaproteobacteria bacterium]|nr:M15 family peptidase [Deltaproteobacteria bacterium]
MKKAAIRMIQAQLKVQGFDPGAEDGVLGPKTRAAIDRVEKLPEDWSMSRKAVGFIQLLAMDNGIDTGPLDGYWGHQTEYAFQCLERKLEFNEEPPLWRPEDLLDLNPHGWPSQTPQENLFRCYGEVGQNQAQIQLPYPHRLAWDKKTVIHNYSCHEKVHDSLLRILHRVLDHYGPEGIAALRLDLWGGCLNVRAMRGGSQYSMHSWGIAVDYDPDRNGLTMGRDRAAFARPEYDAWWRFWEEEGWVSLGRSRNFDWMHVQAAKL